MKIKKLIFAILLCYLPGLLGSLFTNPNSLWYQSLNKPFFNPPGWVFGPVWTLLYIMIGISLYLIIEKDWKKYKIALTFFGIQLFLNGLWSFLFFGLQMPMLAFVEIILLWIFILLTIIWSYRISKLASYLLMPYLAWVSFATVLNLFLAFFG